MPRSASSPQGRKPRQDSLANEIAGVAHALYEQRGRTDGRDVEDWLQAERIVRARRKQAPQPASAHG
ncbi:MAG: DUF2934 domain-containing protein [Candidatus Omnitrophica bacterium]|nr:DUF2934 domain-containing protein [Candidatus Omnitrophota bacterium]